MKKPLFNQEERISIKKYYGLYGDQIPPNEINVIQHYATVRLKKAVGRFLMLKKIIKALDGMLRKLC